MKMKSFCLKVKFQLNLFFLNIWSVKYRRVVDTRRDTNFYLTLSALITLLKCAWKFRILIRSGQTVPVPCASL